MIKKFSTVSGFTWTRLLTSACLASCLAFTLIACNEDSNTGRVAEKKPAQQTTITALIWAPDWPQAMHESTQAFTREHPDIRVDLQFMIGNSVEENLKPKIAANQLPDLVSVNPNSYAAGLAEQGILADISTSAAWDNMLDLLKPDWTSLGNKHFGVAGGVGATMIYYNKEMFQQAGITQLPSNFDEFLSTCEKLKKAGFTPLVLDGGFPNMLGNGPFSYGFANNIAAGKPDWRKDMSEGRLNLNTPETADIFAKIKLLATRGYVQRGYMNTTYDEGLRLFAEGHAAMAFEGSWAANRLMHGQGVNAGVFAPPWNAKGKILVPIVGSETGFAVCNTKNKAAALMLLNFLVGKGFPIQQNARHNFPPMKHIPGPTMDEAQITTYIRQVSSYPNVVPPYYVFLPASTIEMLHPLLQDVLSGKVSPRQAAHSLDVSVRDEARLSRH